VQRKHNHRRTGRNRRYSFGRLNAVYSRHGQVENHKAGMQSLHHPNGDFAILRFTAYCPICALFNRQAHSSSHRSVVIDKQNRYWHAPPADGVGLFKVCRIPTKCAYQITVTIIRVAWPGEPVCLLELH